MTEQEWLACEDPRDLRQAYWRRETDRQFWLYYSACFRRIWHLLTDERSRRAVGALEQYAEGHTTAADLKSFELAAIVAYEEAGEVLATDSPEELAALAVTRVFEFVGPDVCFSEYFIPGRADELAARAANPARSWEERRHQADLKRHIRGNPFHRYRAPVAWPSSVVQPAAAMYQGQDCSFALRDALLETGHPDLAEHFAEKDHPMGCWAVDTILGKS
jgi:hypothetical protein